MTNQLFEAALGIKAPWCVQGVDFDAAKRQLTIAVDFVAGSRFAYPGVAGEQPVHDTQIKRPRHLNFFQRQRYLEVRVPRVRLPDGAVRVAQPDWMGKLDGFTLLFEALVLTLCREMTFAAVAPLVNLSWYRVKAICDRCWTWPCPRLTVRSHCSGHRRNLVPTWPRLCLAGRRYRQHRGLRHASKDAGVVERFANHLEEHNATPAQIKSVSIDMSPAFIKGVDSICPMRA